MQKEEKLPFTDDGTHTNKDTCREAQCLDVARKMWSTTRTRMMMAAGASTTKKLSANRASFVLSASYN